MTNSIKVWIRNKKICNILIVYKIIMLFKIHIIFNKINIIKKWNKRKSQELKQKSFSKTFFKILIKIKFILNLTKIQIVKILNKIVQILKML